jgi:tetratricopeptide (TPR) repeat protein
MENNYFEPLLQSPPASSAVYWNAIQELSEEFPSSSLVQILRAKLAADLNKPEKGSLLKSASVAVLDRALFKQYFENETIPEPKPVQWKSWEFPPQPSNDAPIVTEEPEIQELVVTLEPKAEEVEETVVVEQPIAEAINEPLLAAETIVEVDEIEESVVAFTPILHEVEKVIEIPTVEITDEPQPETDNLVNDLLANLQALKKTHFQYDHINDEVKPEISETSFAAAIDLPEVIEVEEKSSIEIAPAIEVQANETVADIWEAPPLFIPPYEAHPADEPQFDSSAHVDHGFYASEAKEEVELNEELILSDDEKTFLHSELDISESNAMFEFAETDVAQNLVEPTAPDLAFINSIPNHISDDYFKDTELQETGEPILAADDLIDRFLANTPKISAPKADPIQGIQPLKSGEISLPHLPEITTENMASIYLRQGNREKAIETYLKLILKFPEKTAYFTAQIQHAAQAVK